MNGTLNGGLDSLGSTHQFAQNLEKAKRPERSSGPKQGIGGWNSAGAGKGNNKLDRQEHIVSPAPDPAASTH